MPEDKKTIVKMAHIYSQEGRWDKAIAEYKKLIDMEPEDFNSHSMLGDVYVKKGEIQPAFDAFVLCYDAYVRLGQADKAALAQGKIARLNPAPLNPESRKKQEIFKKQQEADAFLESGDTAQAARTYAEVLALDPERFDLYQKLGDLLLQQGDMAGARERYMEIANLYLKNRLVKKALPLFQKVLEIDPDHFEAHAALADVHAKAGNDSEAKKEVLYSTEVLLQQGNLDRAYQFAQKAEQLRAIESYNYLGQIELRRFHPVEARAWFEKLLKFKLAHGGALWGLAKIHAAEGRTADARQTLAKVQKSDRYYGDALLTLAELDAAEGKKESALALYKEAVSLLVARGALDQARAAEEAAFALGGPAPLTPLKAGATRSAGAPSGTPEAPLSVASAAPSPPAEPSKPAPAAPQSPPPGSEKPSAAGSTAPAAAATGGLILERFGMAPAEPDKPRPPVQSGPSAPPPAPEKTPPFPTAAAPAPAPVADRPASAPAPDPQAVPAPTPAPSAPVASAPPPAAAPAEDEVATLMALAKDFESEAAWDEALGLYQRVLALDKSYSPARDGVSRVYRQLAGGSPHAAGRPSAPPVLPPAEDLSKLAALKAQAEAAQASAQAQARADAEEQRRRAEQAQAEEMERAKRAREAQLEAEIVALRAAEAEARAKSRQAEEEAQALKARMAEEVRARLEAELRQKSEEIRRAAEGQARLKAAEGQARLKAAEEQARLKAAEEQARLKAAEEQARLKAAEEQARHKAAEEQARLKAAEEQAKHKAAEEQARLKAAEEQARLKAGDDARRQAEVLARVQAQQKERLEPLRRTIEDLRRRGGGAGAEAPSPSLPAVPAAREEDDPGDLDEFMTAAVADIYVKQGLIQEARKIYERILARDPGDAGARAKLDALRGGAPSGPPPAPGPAKAQPATKDGPGEPAKKSKVSYL